MVKFADRMNAVNTSVIRDILKLTDDPDFISFGGGNPAAESFDKNIIKEITEELLTTHSAEMLQDGEVEGWIPLRDAYIEHIAKPQELNLSRSNVLVTTGATQGNSLSIDAFVNAGDTVLVESPTFLATLSMFTKAGANIVTVEMDEDGMRTDDLERKLAETKARVIYIIPTFQNPTGRTLSLERRKAVARLAAEADAVVMEDDPYRDLRYRGNPLPPIKAFDEADCVVLMNSFSKIIAPGLRVGTVAASEEIIRTLATMKRYSDAYTPIMPQAICAEYLDRGLMPGHIEETASLYRNRLDAMLMCVEKYFPTGTTYTRPEGGLFLWLSLQGKPDMRTLLKEATQKYKVAFVPGAPFFARPDDGWNTFRLNFSSNTPEKIEEGMARLGKAFAGRI
jgi:2-aminoadipate transaminase